MFWRYFETFGIGCELDAIYFLLNSGSTIICLCQQLGTEHFMLAKKRQISSQNMSFFLF